MEGAISSLIVGCDNQPDLDLASALWDAWWEAGGNGFDTAHIYGQGLHEQNLGAWMRSRRVAGRARVIVKGAHTPNCLPDAIEAQLTVSLDRLGLDHAPVYIMHGDNTEVPVAEFVDALDDLHNRGLIGAIGGSNWSVVAAEARAYAQASGRRGLSLLNNLSLAVMNDRSGRAVSRRTRPRRWPSCARVG